MCEFNEFPTVNYANKLDECLRVQSMYIPSMKHALKNVIKSKNVLDMGCGNGLYTHLYLDWGAEKVHGIDACDDIIENCQKFYSENPKLSFATHSFIEKLDFKEEFDLVTAVHVLYYARTLEELEIALDNVARALKPDGEFLAMLVNGDALVDDESEEERRKKFCIKTTPPNKPPKDGDLMDTTFYDQEGNVQCVSQDTYWTRPTYERILRKVGFTDIEWIPNVVDPEYLQKYGLDFFKFALEPVPKVYILHARKSQQLERGA